MIATKVTENEYEIEVYDTCYLHDDYVCGHVKRQPDADEDSDLRYWMFYPADGPKPLSVGDLRRIVTFISKLNVGD